MRAAQSLRVEWHLGYKNIILFSMTTMEEVAQHWKEQSAYDIETAKALFTSKRFPHCLFFCHLAVEKILKAKVVATTGEHAPFTHNLVSLSKMAQLSFSENQEKLIAELNEFNIEARYPDWKKSFYQLATREYTEKILTQTLEVLLWLE